MTMYGVLAPILAFLSATAIGGALVSARSARREAIRARLQDAPLAVANDDGEARRPGLIGFIQRIGAAVEPGGAAAKVRRQLAAAGYHSRGAAALYTGAKVLLLAAGAATGALAIAPLQIPLAAKLWLVIAAAALLFSLPNMVVRLQRRQRATEVRHHLPDAVDLLEICVSSGMGIDTAWNAVADELRRVSTTVGDEMVLTNLEIHLGSPRHVAMRNMAHRTDSDELGSLVSVLIQSERFGTSISDALRTFAASMRERRRQHAEEQAEKVAVKLLFPMMLFIFPVIFIITVGPACINIYNTLILGG